MGFFIGFGLFFMLEPLILNFIYTRNLKTFFELTLTKKNKNKIIEYVKNNY